MTKPTESTGEDRKDIGCLRALEMFYAYVDGELEDPEAEVEFEHHMAHCRACYSRVEMEGLLTERLKNAASEHASDALRRRLRILMNNF